MNNMKQKEPIPEFKNRQEEAVFWDTHEMADYWQDWKPVKVRFAKKLSSILPVRLDSAGTVRGRDVCPSQRGVVLPLPGH